MNRRNQSKRRREAKAKSLAAIPARESLALEKRALKEGWLYGGDYHQQKRQDLMGKLFEMALDPNTPANTVIAIARTLTHAEHRHLELMLRAAGHQGDLPRQVNVDGDINIQNNTEMTQDAPESTLPPPSVRDIVNELLSRKEVQDSLDAEITLPAKDYATQ